NIGISPSLGAGDVSMFTDPSQTTFVTGHLDRNVAVHPNYSGIGNVVTVAFRFTYTYKGVTSPPIYAYTVASRRDYDHPIQLSHSMSRVPAFFRRLIKRAAGYTITELMIAVTIMLIVGGIIFIAVQAGLTLFAKNLAVNQVHATARKAV